MEVEECAILEKASFVRRGTHATDTSDTSIFVLRDAMPSINRIRCAVIAYCGLNAMTGLFHKYSISKVISKAVCLIMLVQSCLFSTALNCIQIKYGECPSSLPRPFQSDEVIGCAPLLLRL